MTARMSKRTYLKKLKIQNIKSIPLEDPINYATAILHRCTCNSKFSRSPAHMLCKHATGVCKTCQKEVKRQNKISEIDNGYLKYCLKKGFSCPVDPSSYKNRHFKIKHICHSCEKTYLKSPNKAYRPTYLGVCPKCTDQLVKRKKIETKEKIFTQKLNKIEDAPLIDGIFAGATYKLNFKCRCGCSFQRTPRKVEKGSIYCTTCSNETRSSKQKLTVKEIIEKVKQKQLTCSLLSTEYRNQKSRLRWKCECNKIFKRPYPTLLKGNGSGLCPKCGKNQKTIQSRKSQEEYDNELKLLRPEISRLEPYTNSTTPTRHKCKCGNTSWFPRPNNLLHSKDLCGCDKGFISEKIVRKILEHLLGIDLPSKKPRFLRLDKKTHLQLDGYNEEFSVAFEHQGIQHYQFVEHFHRTIADFERLKRNDKIKMILCKKNNVTLLIIPNIIDRVSSLRNSVVKQEYIVSILAKICEDADLPVNKDKFEFNWTELLK